MRPLPAVRAAIAAALLLLPPLQPVPASASDPPDAAAEREITAAEAKKAAMLLAGPRFLGRGTGQKGNRDAALWIAGNLRAAGLEPGPAPDGGADGRIDDADFLQEFTIPGARVNSPSEVKTANVVGILRGTGHAAGAVASGSAPAEGAAPAPGPPEEAVVLGAHFDHLGVRGGVDPKKPPKKSGVFWGADDNGSGTTAALLVSRTLGRLQREGVRPRRTIVVCFFTGEEIGLVGSKHYVTAPLFPLKDTVAMINIDMVGRNALKYVEVYGNGTSPELDEWHRKALLKTKLECTYPAGDVFFRSDQWNFYEAGIPAMFWFGGFHKDYHTVRDVPELLNFPKIALIARQAFEVLWLAANDERRPSFRKIDMQGAGGKLGLAVDPATPEEEEPLGLDEGKAALRVTTVFAGSLGAKHFEVGDVITHWNGISFEDDDPVGKFNAFVAATRAGDRITFRYSRGKERKAALVQF